MLDEPDDRFNYNPYNYVETPNERINLFAKGRFNLTDTTDLTLFGTYQNLESDLTNTIVLWLSQWFR